MFISLCTEPTASDFAPFYAIVLLLLVFIITGLCADAMQNTNDPPFPGPCPKYFPGPDVKTFFNAMMGTRDDVPSLAENKQLAADITRVTELQKRVAGNPDQFLQLLDQHRETEKKTKERETNVDFMERAFKARKLQAPFLQLLDQHRETEKKTKERETNVDFMERALKARKLEAPETFVARANDGHSDPDNLRSFFDYLTGSRKIMTNAAATENLRHHEKYKEMWRELELERKDFEERQALTERNRRAAKHGKTVKTSEGGARAAPDEIGGEDRETDDEAKECVVCMDGKKQYVMVPCGHLLLCNACAKRYPVSTCPLCRDPVQSVMRIFE